MRHTRKAILLAILAGLLAPALIADAPDPGAAAKPKISRWESNLSAGAVIGRRIGIVKSIWWFAVPEIFALGPSFEFVGPFVSFSLNVAANAPLGVNVEKVVADYVGAGISWKYWICEIACHGESHP
jgi:hypothetical protein